MKLLNEDIYKTYKHGGSLKDLSPSRVYKALKENGLQVVMVMNEDFEKMVYNYLPEENRFFKIR